MRDSKKAIRDYMRKRAFNVEDYYGGVVLQGIRPWTESISDVVEMVRARDGAITVSSATIGLRVNDVEAAFDLWKTGGWVVPMDAPLRKEASPARISLRFDLKLPEQTDLSAYIDGLFNELHSQFQTPQKIREEVIRRMGLSPKVRPLSDRDLEKWLDIFESYHSRS